MFGFETGFFPNNGDTHFSQLATSMGVCDPLYPPGSYLFYRTLGSTVICVLGAATSAGLTMGLISLDEMELLILVECSEDDCETVEEREELKRNQTYAKLVLPLVQRHHQLLVTLLLLNSLANESLPLFLDSLVPSWLAIVLSVSFILLFGEILPSAIFTGNAGLRISASLSPVVYIAMALTYPIVAPIAWILDRWLQHESDSGGKYSKAQLLALLRLHMMREGESYSPEIHWGGSGELDDGNASSSSAASSNRKRQSSKRALHQNEVKMMKGAMNLRGTRAKDVMTRIEDVFMLENSQKLDLVTLAQIVEKGHSRIPVYNNGDRDDIRGILLTKKLTAISPDDARDIASIGLRPPTFVHPDDTLASVLKTLKMSRSHLAIVTNHPREMLKRFDERGVWRGSHTPSENTSSNLFVEPVLKSCQMYGVVALLDIIQRLVDEKLDEEDQYIPPILSESMLGNSGTRWSFHEDKPVIVEPRVEFSRLGFLASTVRAKFSGRKRSSSGDLEQPLLFAPSTPIGLQGRKVSFSETVEVVNFVSNDGASEASESSIV